MLTQSKFKRNSSRSLFGKRGKRNYKYTPAAANAALAKRELLEEVREITQLVGVGLCYPYKNGFARPKKALELLQAGFTPRNCGNCHACPVCSSRYMAVRRAQFEAAAEAWVKNGGYMMQLKLSVRHDPETPSADKYRALMETWTRMRNKAHYKAVAGAVNNPHFVKILEEVVTVVGIFPHLHVIWLFDKGIGKKNANDFLKEVQKLWCETANSHSLGAELTGQFHGELNSNNVPGIGHYFFKHGYFDLGLQPLENETLDPFGALRRHLLTGEIEYLIYWLDFEAASSRQTRVRFSKGFPFVSNAPTTI